MTSPQPDTPSLTDFDQDDVARERPAEACLEEVNERHSDLPQNDPI